MRSAPAPAQLPPTADSRLAGSPPPQGQPALSAPPRPSDEALQATIAERFAGAYEAQLGYLSRVAATEQQQLQRDIDGFRAAAYAAQRRAAEHRSRAEAARQGLAHGTQSVAAMREALQRTRQESEAEAVAHRASQERLRHEEAALEHLQAQVREETGQLSARIAAAQRTRLQQEQRGVELRREIAEARAEREAEVAVAAANQRRAAAAGAARDVALQELRRHEDLAVRSLREAVAKLENDFARERADFELRDRRAAARLRELEEELDHRRDAGVSGGSSLGPGPWSVA